MDGTRFPCLIQDAVPGRAVFMQVAEVDDVVEDVVHEDLFSGGRARSLYVPPSLISGRDGGVEEAGQLQWYAGALIYACPPTSDAPDFSPAQEVLDGLPHCLPGTSASVFSYGAHPCDTVLLGPGSSQVTLRLLSDDVQRECATVLELHPDDLWLHRQEPPFECLWIAGRPVSVVYGWRTRQQVDLRRGFGLFVDCRQLGLPVCYKRFFKAEVSVFELISLLGVQLVEGMRAAWSFDAGLHEAAESVELKHGDSVMVWFEPETHAASSNGHSPPGPLSEEDEPGEPAGPDGSSGGGLTVHASVGPRPNASAGRSRSPRAVTGMKRCHTSRNDDKWNQVCCDHVPSLERQPGDTSVTLRHL